MNAKKLVSGCMAALLLAGSATGIVVQAKTGKATAYLNQKSGALINQKSVAMQTDYYEVETIENSVKKPSLKAVQRASAYRLSESEWVGSGCDYYFRQLNTVEKKLYLELKKQADIYLTGIDNFQTTAVSRGQQQVQASVLPLISYQGLDTAQMKKVFSYFYFENPQYYFMRNSVIYSEKKGIMTVGLYDVFADGKQRQEYTNQLRGQLAVWEGQIAKKETVAEKEQLIHQIVCMHTSYNHKENAEDPDDSRMTQSCISAILFDHTSLCNGYAQFFSLLCNRAGIRCITVTSNSHAWNKVCMGNTWYNVDCTWDDSRGDGKFLNVTDAALRGDDTQVFEHTESDEWKDVAPACTKLFDLETANSQDTGADIQPPAKIVELTVTNSGKGKVQVRYSPAGGCDGYALQYAANTSFNTPKKKTSETAEVEISGLTSGKTYYFRARAYVLDSNGEYVYGAYSKKVKAAVL